MLKKSTSFVLASLRSSTYGNKQWQNTYPLACNRSERVKRSLVCTYSPLRLVRPRWTAILSILHGCLAPCRLKKRQAGTVTKLTPEAAPILLFAAPETELGNDRLEEHISHADHGHLGR